MSEYFVTLKFEAVSENESFARVVAAAFLTRLDPTLDELSDIKTAISEAVTNSIIHAYENKGGIIQMDMSIKDNDFIVDILDFGVGIENIDKAMEPMYTTSNEGDRSGMGFVFMEAFMDELKVQSKLNQGTKVHMKKRIGIMDRNALED